MVVNMGSLTWALIGVAAIITVAQLSRNEDKETMDEKIARHKGIANFKAFNARCLQDRLSLRALPNARLTEAFDIHNSFTTTDEGVHKEFLGRARSIVETVDATAWQGCRELAAEVLKRPELFPEPRVSVQRVTRVVCLHVVLELLFSTGHAFNIDIEAADSVADKINWLWLQSKEHGAAGSPATAGSLASLRSRLSELVPNTDDDPLALIIPAYETLWRVVLLTYVHVAFRRLDADSKKRLSAVVSDLSLKQMDFSEDVQMFAREALRLYPPTKRIYRADDTCTLAADVESLHHDPRIWGENSLEFCPGRFTALTKPQRDAYMPFGVGQHACPAGHGFGAKIISLLVVTLVERLGTSKHGARIWFGDERLDGDDSVPLPTGRDDMEDWMVSPCNDFSLAPSH